MDVSDDSDRDAAAAAPQQQRRLLAPKAAARALRKTTMMPRHRINLSSCRYRMVRECAEALGWEVCDDAAEDWHFYWTDTSVNHARVRGLSALQKLNHFADMSGICRKAHCADTLAGMLRLAPREYDFFPASFSLPRGYAGLCRSMAAARGDLETAILLKPDRGCQGTDITMVRSLAELEDKSKLWAGGTEWVAQQYVCKPLLLDGFKFDLRLYVLVTSCSPLRVHLFDDGLGRLCTEKYVASDAQPEAGAKGGQGQAAEWKYRHLTNYAINKTNPAFKEGEGGSKRSLKSVLATLRAQGHAVDALWQRIGEVAVKTVLAIQPVLAHSYSSCRPAADAHAFSCFELLGLDMLVDEQMRPWLLEVNHSPSLATDTSLDAQVKRSLLMGAMRLSAFSSAEGRRVRRAARDAQRVRCKPPATGRQLPAAATAQRRASFDGSYGRPSCKLSLGGGAAALASVVGGGGGGVGGVVGGVGGVGVGSLGLANCSVLVGSRRHQVIEAATARKDSCDAHRRAMLSLRAEYEDANQGGFRRIYPDDDAARQANYERLLSMATAAFSSSTATRHGGGAASTVRWPLDASLKQHLGEWRNEERAKRLAAVAAASPPPPPPPQQPPPPPSAGVAGGAAGRATLLGRARAPPGGSVAGRAATLLAAPGLRAASGFEPTCRAGAAACGAAMAAPHSTANMLPVATSSLGLSLGGGLRRSVRPSLSRQGSFGASSELGTDSRPRPISVAAGLAGGGGRRR